LRRLNIFFSKSYNSFLNLQGNFQSIHHITDKKVYVGLTECRDIFTSDTTLNCTAPDKPQELDREGNANVFVSIGLFDDFLSCLTILDTTVNYIQSGIQDFTFCRQVLLSPSDPGKWPVGEIPN
jgi:hypothetical protein